MTTNLPKFVTFTKIPRLFKDCVVTEKIDGSNGVIFISDEGEMFIGSRNRWLSAESDNFGFHRWATENKDELMKLGAGMHHGEWWGCLDSETSVKLADGSTKKIGVIVGTNTANTIVREETIYRCVQKPQECKRNLNITNSRKKLKL